MYALGTTFPPQDIDTLLATDKLTGSRAPHSTYQEYASTEDALDGTLVTLGFPVAVWIFDALRPEMVNKLRSVCPGPSASVYITTLRGDESYATYAALMLWPVEQSTRRQVGGLHTQLSITFRRLQMITQANFSLVENSQYLPVILKAQGVL